MSTNIGETLDRLSYNGFTIPFFAPSDTDFLLGSGSSGVKVPQGETVSIHQHASSVTDGITVTVHNITRGTSVDVAFGANTYEEQDAELYFGEGDEMAIEVNGTTDASDGYLLLEHQTQDEHLGGN